MIFIEIIFSILYMIHSAIFFQSIVTLQIRNFLINTLSQLHYANVRGDVALQKYRSRSFGDYYCRGNCFAVSLQRQIREQLVECLHFVFYDAILQIDSPHYLLVDKFLIVDKFEIFNDSFALLIVTDHTNIRTERIC